MKDALGVRKSCDASILTPRKSILSTSTKTTSPITTPTTKAATHKFGSTEEVRSSNNNNNNNNTEETVNLETAIQAKLNVTSKPRSRSLIWRPARKSRTAVESTDCRIS